MHIIGLDMSAMQLHEARYCLGSPIRKSASALDRRHVVEHDHRGAAPDNTQEDIVRSGRLKRDIEPETITIKPNGGGDIVHNEERRNP